MRDIGPFAIAVVFVAIATSSPASAGDSHHDPQTVVQHIFDNADTDRNGSLSAAEYEGAGLERFGVTFEESDADGDGETSIEEYLELYRRYHPPHDQGEA